MRRRDSPLYLVFKITQRLELGWRPLNGGLSHRGPMIASADVAQDGGVSRHAHSVTSSDHENIPKLFGGTD
jgi:hypothetical protein